jgi:hypothetical protein
MQNFNSLLISDHHQDISAKYSSEDLLKVAVLDQMIFLQKQSCVSDGISIRLLLARWGGDWEACTPSPL